MKVTSKMSYERNAAMTNDFVSRHIGPSQSDIDSMLSVVGVQDLDILVAETIPPVIRDAEAPDLGPPLDECEALRVLKRMVGKNTLNTSVIGQGYYGTILPF